MPPIVGDQGLRRASMSLGVAIVGTGWVSGEHIKAFQANACTEVRAIVSRDKARAVAKAAQYNLAGVRTSDRLQEVLEDPAIQIVSICTPHHLHVAQSVASARAG